MLLIHCPYCEEERPELEFRHAGEAHIARPENIAEITDEEFERYFFIRSNPKGIVFERWRHVHGCARFFNAARDTVSDRFLLTYKAGEPKPDLEHPDSCAQARAAGGRPATTSGAAPAKPASAQAKVARAATKKPADARRPRTPKGVK